MLGMIGRFHLLLRDKNGRVLMTQRGRNLVTSTGEKLAAYRFSAIGTKSPVDYITLGEGNTPPLKSDTVLDSQVDASDTQGDDVASDNQVTWSFTISGPVAGSWAVKEAGIFNDDYTKPTRWMAARFLTQPFTMGVGDSLDVTWTIEFEGVD
jgi:hypothetical protein